MEQRFREAGGFDAALFTKITGIVPSQAQVEALQTALLDPDVSYLTSVIATVFEKEFAANLATGWSSHNHTSESVDLMAFGPGSEAVGGYMKNYQLFEVMTRALGLA
jgi:alkaline phosphatase